ncbi:MAG: hypothetical protein INH41_06860 [Myxococcaceae bacterium]|nr:hypothetical protein [Myxococcaceae bacterium]MCA3012110.1 hypothetical protein [Myxococcaceae bacterium]
MGTTISPRKPTSISRANAKPPAARPSQQRGGAERAKDSAPARRADGASSFAPADRSREARRATPGAAAEQVRITSGGRPVRPSDKDPNLTVTTSGKGQTSVTATDANDVVVEGRGVTVVAKTTNAPAPGAADTVAVQAARASALAEVPRDAGKDAPLAVKLGKGGELTVTGTDGADAVTLRQADGKVIVESAGRQVAAFDASAVKRVTVDAGKGNDTISVIGLDLKNVTLRGGAGDDQIQVLDSKHVAVHGGRGDDRLTLVNTEKVTANGGRGADAITDTGSDRLRVGGGRGDDRLTLTETARSKVTGGAGKDRVVLRDANGVEARAESVWLDTSQAAPPARPAASQSASTAAAPVGGTVAAFRLQPVRA